MTIEPYEHEKHYEMLRRWLKRRGLTIIPKDYFSDIGYVVNGKAIGFLFTTQSKQAYIDHVAGDPDASEPERDEALTHLFLVLEGRAYSLGYKMVTALAALPKMKRRFLECGYHPHGDYTLFVKFLADQQQEEQKCLG